MDKGSSWKLTAGPGFPCFHVPWLKNEEPGPLALFVFHEDCSAYWGQELHLGGCWGVLGWILEILGECNSVMNRVMVGSVCTVLQTSGEERGLFHRDQSTEDQYAPNPLMRVQGQRLHSPATHVTPRAEEDKFSQEITILHPHKEAFPEVLYS